MVKMNFTNSIRESPMAEPLSQLQHPRLKDLYLFWRARRRDSRVPLADRFDPSELRPWVSNMAVMEIEQGDAVYAYYGPNLQRSFGSDRAGQTLEDLPAGPREILAREYADVCSSGQPSARTYTADFHGRRQTWERLVLPLSEDGLHVSRLMVAAFEVRPRA